MTAIEVISSLCPVNVCSTLPVLTSHTLTVLSAPPETSCFPFEVKAKYLIGAFVLLDFFFGVTNYQSGIAHFAHLGGALTGFVMVHVWKMANLR